MNLIRGHYAEGVVRLSGADNRLGVADGWQKSIEQALGGQGEVILGFRPESAWLKEDGALSGEVYARELQGAYSILHVNINSDEIVHIRADRQINYPIGTQVRFDLDPRMARFFDPKTEAAIQREVVA